MSKSLRQIIKQMKYRQEASLLGLAILSLLSLFVTVFMLFFSPNKAILLFFVTLILFALFLYYRTHNDIHVRASITTLKYARAKRRSSRKKKEKNRKS